MNCNMKKTKRMMMPQVPILAMRVSQDKIKMEKMEAVEIILML